MWKILLTDDHEVIRKGLKLILLEAYPSAVISEVRDAEDTFKILLHQQFDIVISDLSLPGRSGLDIIEFVKKEFPKLPILILSMHPEEQYAIRVLKAGAAGYLSKDTAAEELVKAVQRVLQGRKYISASLAEKMAADLNEGSKPPHETLSNREFNVMKLLAEGKSPSEVAAQLSISITTVSTYRARIMQKTNMRTNADLTKYCIEHKLI